MTEVPVSDWSSTRVTDAEPPFPADWMRVPGMVVHVFTHFRLQLAVFRANVGLSAKTPAGSWWSPASALATEALPSVIKKAVEAALPGATSRRAA
jgi:A/G-specific adenine glycosylase